MKETFEIETNEKGITLRENLHRIFWLWDVATGGDGFRERSVEWREIYEVYVYKRDVYIVDLICIMLRTSAADARGFELHEQMQGWQVLVEKLPEYLPECAPFHEWFMEVAFPAFEFNLIKIYPRENQ